MMNPVKTICLSVVDGVSYDDKLALIMRHGSAINLFECYEKNSTDKNEIALCEKIFSKANQKKAKDEIEKIRSVGGWMIALGAPEYPKNLSQIDKPPLVLFGKGKWPRNYQKFIGFIGPRKPSQYGMRTAKWIANDL
ncbi:MAG: DNA-processing protein DprA, partial [Bdellovibrionales bacterium]|nr:DNA-processing protein DprA [Bdellovibrionales bacterium]